MPKYFISRKSLCLFHKYFYGVSGYDSFDIPTFFSSQAVQLTKFDYRLSNRLNKDLQKLRCRVNYHALKFTTPIVEMGRTLVERMRSKSSHFIALHLR